MVKEMLSTLRWCRVEDDMTKALTLTRTLKHDHFLSKISHSVKLHDFRRVDNKIHTPDFFFFLICSMWWVTSLRFFS